MDNSGLQSYVTFDPRAWNISNLSGGQASDTVTHGAIGSSVNDPKNSVSYGQDIWARPVTPQYTPVRQDPMGFLSGSPDTNSEMYKGSVDLNKSMGLGQTNNVSGNAATPGAISALSHPDLKNRRPSLAAGWGGWDQGSTNGPAGTSLNNGNMSTGAGNANFTYFSRFS